MSLPFFFTVIPVAVALALGAVGYLFFIIISISKEQESMQAKADIHLEVTLSASIDCAAVWNSAMRTGCPHTM